MFECNKWDLQVGDSPTLARHALLMASSEWRRLALLAERLTGELYDAERELAQRPELFDTIGVPKAIRRALVGQGRVDAASSVRFARFDFHPTTDGWRISEVNADVPGGFIEAAGLADIYANYLVGARSPGNPAAALAQALAREARSAHVALVHATAYSDDRQTMVFLKGLLERDGQRCTLASPAHVDWRQGNAHLVTDGGPLDAIIRFFPCEWLPALGSTCNWQVFCSGGKTRVSNPGTAILSQSKRLPLVWKHLRTDLSTWSTVLPETRDPRDADSDLESWVFKPTFGRVGEDVGVAGAIPSDRFASLVARARREIGGWVAQRRFRSVMIDSPDGGCYPCLGIFTVDGRAAGCYARISRTPIVDALAQDTVLLIVDDGAGAEHARMANDGPH